MFFPLLLAASGVAPATIEDDLHCAALFALVAGMSEDEAKKRDVVSGFLYYVGKLDGRSPGYDLESGLAALLTQPGYMTEVLPKDADRCAAELTSRGSDLEKIGEALKGRAKG